MVCNDDRLAALAAGRDPDDRYAVWPRLRARWALFALVAILIASALVPIKAGQNKVETAGFVENLTGKSSATAERPRDEDLKLYDVAIERIRGGENYYDFIAEEHRKSHYPVRPGLAVRLPTLAYISATIGETGQYVASVLLLIAVLTAWWFRLGSEPGGSDRRIWAMALLFVGASLGTNSYFFQLHELWSGMLIALAFGLHRPAISGSGGRWVASLLVAAMALAIREHSLPFVLLMAALAFWRKAWKEGAAWTALILVFFGMLAVHLQIVAQHALPSDPLSPSWWEFRGLSGWMSNIILSSNLRFLPGWLAGPAVILMIFGWSGWKTWAGVYGTLLYLGYGLLFMLAGRGDNFYWGVGIAPAMFIGLAFVPRAVKSLLRAAIAK